MIERKRESERERKGRSMRKKKSFRMFPEGALTKHFFVSSIQQLKEIEAHTASAVF